MEGLKLSVTRSTALPARFAIRSRDIDVRATEIHIYMYYQYSIFL